MSEEQGNNESTAPESQRPLSQLYDEMAAEAEATAGDPDVAAAAQPDGPDDGSGDADGAEQPAEPVQEGQDPVGGEAGEPASAAPADPAARTNADLERRDAELIREKQQIRQAQLQAQQIQQGFQHLTELARSNPLEAVRHLGVDTQRLYQQLMFDEPPEQQQQQQPDPMAQQAVQLSQNANQQIQALRIELALQKSNEYPLLTRMAEQGSGIVNTIMARQNQGEPLHQVAQDLENQLTDTTFGVIGTVKDNPAIKAKIAEMLGIPLPSGNGAQAQQPATQTPPPAAPQAKPAQTLRQDMKGTPPQSDAREPQTIEEARERWKEIMNSQPMFLDDDPVDPELERIAKGIKKD